MKRQLPNFLDGWAEYTDPLPTPQLFRIWACLGIVSSALSRRVWIKANSRMPLCYPNLYLMLVGPPGVGKDVAINKAADLLIRANAESKHGQIARLGGESISPKGLVDKLADNASKQTFSYSDGPDKITAEFHSLTFCIGELGTAIPEYDPRLIPLLNDLYNNKPSYEDSIRGIEVKIPNPHITLILGNQPNTLAEVFPERTFRMGFTSRIIFVYCEHPVIKDLFIEEDAELKWDQELEGKLSHDLQQMTQMTGGFKVPRETRDMINEFNRTRPGEVESTRFQDYNTRRTLHLQKVAMCVSACESNRRIITPKHWERAVQLLFDAELKMPQIFAEVTTSRGFSETLTEIRQMGDANGRITLHAFMSKLARTRPPYEVKQMLELAIAEGTLKEVLDEAGAPKRPKEFYVD